MSPEQSVNHVSVCTRPRRPLVHLASKPPKPARAKVDPLKWGGRPRPRPTPSSASCSPCFEAVSPVPAKQKEILTLSADRALLAGSDYLPAIVGALIDKKGSAFLVFTRFKTSPKLNWLGESSPLSSLHSSGTATSAPGRARTAKSAIAVAV